jgi:MFS family permease
MGPRALQNAIMAACGAAFLLFGYDQGVISGLLTGETFERQFPKMSVDPQLQGLVVAIYEIGCFLGALLTFVMGERFGRRRMIMFGMVVLSIGAAIQTASYGVPELIVGRIIAGVGNGFSTATVPVYHSETSKAQDRGRAVCIELAINIAGVCTAYWLDYGMSFVKTSTVQWRFPLSFQIFFAIVTFVMMSFLPESPRWLVAQGREAEAMYVLQRLDISTLPNSKSLNMLNAEQEFQVIKETLEEERKLANGKPVWRDILTNGKERHFQRALLGFGIQFMQQVSGKRKEKKRNPSTARRLFFLFSFFFFLFLFYFFLFLFFFSF